ncbi:MAG: 50S ribosomal protein L10 [Thermoproteota archaeon]|mgnify:CR=1 FL=1|nr:MAG: 50S ribosomal protein L10 [Candidatus Korarchaeota archaeon]RLG48490.1 MAG: 50S ribosomal protein L10 [Candidatus Korarchaeota archaeon]RLG52257.1 MAG: 50S ribosomal protein L10 [Candidatus Korarchaeota archaeon]
MKLVSKKALKAKQIERIKKLAKEYPVILFADFERVPANAFQRLRKELAPETKLVVVKKKLVPLAFKEVDRPGLQKLLEYVPNNLVIVFSKRSPTKIYRQLVENKINVFVKPNDIAQKDIVIPEGPTDLMPGPILTDLRALGVKTKIKGSKVWIDAEKLLVKAGERIDATIADVLHKLGIKAMEVYIRPSAAVDADGILYLPEVLSMTSDKVEQMMKEAFQNAFKLALELGEIDKSTVGVLMQKAYAHALSLATEIGWISPETLPELLKKAYIQAKLLQEKIKSSS